MSGKEIARTLAVTCMVGSALLVGWTGPRPGWAKTGVSLMAVSAVFALAMFAANLLADLRDRRMAGGEDGWTDATASGRR